MTGFRASCSLDLALDEDSVLQVERREEGDLIHCDELAILSTQEETGLEEKSIRQEAGRRGWSVHTFMTASFRWS